jgi:hypothetical protein
VATENEGRLFGVALGNFLPYTQTVSDRIMIKGLFVNAAALDITRLLAVSSGTLSAPVRVQSIKARAASGGVLRSK